MKTLSDKIFSYFKFVVLLFLLLTLVIKLVVGYGKESWGITEFLINYEAGFIRRGLLGQIFFELYQSLGVSPYHVIIAFCLICYFGLAFYFIKKFRDFKISNTLLLSSFLFTGPIVNNYWLRKDCFLLLCFLLIVKALVSDKISRGLKFLIINLAGIIAVLNHESFIFWGILPVYLIITAQQKTFSLKNLLSGFIKTSVFILPILISALSCLYFSGTKEMKEVIIQSWENIYFPFHLEKDSEGAMEAIGESFRNYAWPKFVQLFTTFSFWVYVPLGVAFGIIVSVSLCYLLLNKSPKRSENISNGKILLGLLIFQTLGITVLSVVGCDYGRWMFFWIASSFIMYLVVPLPILVNLVSYVENIANLITDAGKKIRLNKINPKLLYIVCGITLAHWELIFYLPSTPIGLILNPILYLLKLPNTLIWGV